jgi:signal transduction histidine kinase
MKLHSQLKLAISISFLLAIGLVVMEARGHAQVSNSQQFFKVLVATLILFAACGWLIYVFKSFDEMKKTLQNHETKKLDAQNLLADLDLATRREVATWLHGNLQSKLVHISRTLAEEGHEDASLRISDLNEYTVRAMAHSLFPYQIEIALEIALTDLCSTDTELQMSDNLRFGGLKNFSSLGLPVALRIAIYRIIEEGINNARKKPTTQKVSVTVEADAHQIHISVLDDGARLIDNPSKSMGLHLIDLYVNKYDGVWSLVNTKDGVLLEAFLNHSAQSVKSVAPSRLVDRLESQIDA